MGNNPQFSPGGLPDGGEGAQPPVVSPADSLAGARVHNPQFSPGGLPDGGEGAQPPVVSPANSLAGARERAPGFLLLHISC